MRVTGTALTAAVAGCASSGDEPAATANGTGGSGTTTHEGDSPVRIEHHDLTEDYFGDARVSGELTNAGDTELSYVEVNARLYNEAGTRIGDGFDNASDVAPGETITFEVMTMVPYDDVADYELEVSTSP